MDRLTSGLCVSDVTRGRCTQGRDCVFQTSPDGAVPKGEECAVPKGRECTVPKGRECAVMLVRFPDAFLASFRDCIQQEQNCLLDTEQAFLAALCPQVTSLSPWQLHHTPPPR